MPSPEAPPPRTPGDVATDLFTNGLPEPSDDTPTIISKGLPRPAENNLLNGLLRGRTLAHFELIEPIGVGGMAAVLRARDTQLDRSVALKILPPDMAVDPENVRRFHQEARAAAKLDHETIARVFFCGEDQGLHFIAFEYVEGDNLRAILDRRGPLPVQEALHCMLQIATGLAHAAERGVVHRDIKPSNIIVSSNGRAKLVDMGLARSLEPHADDGLTQSGVTLGTFDYISPEQALEPREADSRSDIYSLGCTFYHILTGVAPVPEGTAAKKLHHHQHVLPTDPRELNSEVPDDVAAVLGKMMAKDVRQRYQRPEQLVEHLLQVTQRLGSGDGRADGVLFVDAPLPDAPRTRPLLVAGLAATIVIVLVFLVGTPPRSGVNDAAPPIGPAAKVGDDAGRPVPSPATSGAETAVANNAAVPELRQRVSSWRQLADLARLLQADKELKVVDLTVTEDFLPAERGDAAESSVVLRGRKIILRGEGKDGRRPTLWALGKEGERDPWPGLTLDAAETVELYKLRFVLDAGLGRTRGGAGVQLRGARAYKVSECDFVQITGSAPADTQERFASVGIGAAGAARAPETDFQACGFFAAGQVERAGPNAVFRDVKEGGQDAVVIGGAVVVRAEGCAFAPHAALFHFREGGRKSSLALAHCTAMVGDEWALAQCDERTACDKVKAEACLFARVADAPERAMMMTEPRFACLLRQADRGGEAMAYVGKQNRYFNLDAVRLRTGDEGTAVEPEPFAAQLDELRGTDEKVLPSALRPWKEKDPRALLAHLLEPKDLLAAFAVDLDRPSLAAELLLGPNLDQVAGLHKATPWGALYEGQVPPRGARAASGLARRVVVDPTKDTGAGVYRTLGEALGAVEPGDDILIALRHNGALKVHPATLRGNVTLKAEDGYRPVLLLDDVSDRDAALRVQGGQLTLENLEIRLSSQGAGETVSAVALPRDGGVLFKRCVLTLEGMPKTLAAVSLPDVREGAAGRDGAGPHVDFRGCFVRGEGDLVASRNNHPFRLTVAESLVALTGSLLSVDNADESSPPAPGKKVLLTLDHVTTYLGANLVRLRCRDLRYLVPVEVDRASSSLFASAAADGKASLIHLDGPSAAGDELKKKLTWKGGDNVYSRAFANMVDGPPRGDNEMPADGMSWEAWRAFAAEAGSRNGMVNFAGPLWPTVPPAEVTRDAFKVEGGGPQHAGARPQELPEPSAP